MKRHKWLLTLLLAVFLLGGGAFLLWQTGFFSSVGSLEEMRNYIERFAPYSHLFFFLIQLLSVVIAPIPSNVTALAGAVLFGMWPSFLMTWLAVAGGSVWSQSSNIAEKKIKELLLGVRYQQELLFFFVFHNGSRLYAGSGISF